MKITTKLILGLTMLLAFTWIVALYAAYTGYNNLRSEIAKETATGTRAMVNRIDRLLSDRVQYWSTYGKLHSVQDHLSESNLRFSERPDIQAWMDQQDEIWQLGIERDRGDLLYKQLVNNRISKDLVEMLDAIDTDYGHRIYGEVFVTNRYGAIVALSGRTSDYRQNDEAWWQHAMREGVYIGQLEYDESAHSYSIALCIRIDDEGQPVGVIKAVYDISEITKLVHSHAALSDDLTSISVTLVTDDGRLVAGSQSANVLEDVSPTLPHPTDDRVPGASDVFRNWDPETDRHVLVASIPFPPSTCGGCLNWTLLVERDEAAIIAPAIRFKWRIITAAFVGTVIAFVFGIALSKSLATRVHHLVDAACQIGHGRFDLAIPVKGRDELGRLGDALKQMRDKLNSQTMQLQMTQFSVDRSPDAVLWWTSDGQIKYANQAACSQLGYSSEELSCLLIADVHDGVSPDMWEDIWREIKRDGCKTFHIDQRAKDGTVFPTEVSANVLEFDGWEYGCSIVRDLTDRRRIEDAEREQQHLQDALKSMEQVIAVIGHELRTPLAALRATSEFLISDSGQAIDDSEMFLHNIHNETLRMADMVNNMLEAARLNSGSAKWAWGEVSISHAVDEALNVIRPLIDHGRITLEVEVDPSLKMRGDAEALQRLLINLVSNSAKHTSDGYISIMAFDRSEAQECWIQIEVSDSGEGIPESVIKKLGKAFVLNSGMVGSDYVKGAGLGLAICKGIAAAHGGRITVKSEDGVGSNFAVHLRADLPGPHEANQLCEIQEALT